MQKIILIKYGELTTKKANRNLFVNKIYENIKDTLSDYSVKITKYRVRMFIEPENDNDIEDIISKVKNIFGIHSIVLSYKVNTNIEEIK